MILDKLFKKSSTGKTLVWFREVEGDSYRTHSGQIDGAITQSAWTVCKPKNVGRSNETSGAEQAALECESAYTKKLAQGGYHTSEADIDEAKFFKPMLAKVYEDRPEPRWGLDDVFSQPKFDGIRCIATKDGLFSRQGKPLTATPHITDQLADFFAAHPDAILDGELYADKLAQDFNKIISLVRKVNPDAERIAEAAAIVEYFIYDLPSHPGDFGGRYDALIAAEELDQPSIQLVVTHKVTSLEQLDALNGEYITAGYEGQMVRLNGPYKNGRSADLLKRKVFKDAEFKVVAITEGIGNRAGMAGFITYELGDGRTFDSGIRGSWDYAKQLLIDADTYVGGEGTVRYFNLTPAGIPRFPITVALYPDGRDV